MTLDGKGIFIWKIPSCEGGNPAAIAAVAQEAQLKSVFVKIADGINPFNLDPQTKQDLVPPLVRALHARNIQVWGWHYIYGNDPIHEAQTAVERVTSLGLDGYVIDAEIEYKRPGKEKEAKSFMAELRKGLPILPVALSSYRFPSLHAQFPWDAFLEKCDLNMPQVYWEQAHNPADQLHRTHQEFLSLNIVRPLIPTGPVYQVGYWAPTENDILEFLDTAVSLGESSANFYSWDACRATLPALWETVARYSWSSPSAPTPDIPQQFMSACNLHDLDQILNLYRPDAVHVTSSGTVQGEEAIRAWYTTFFTQTFPEAIFKLSSVSGSGNSRNFSWQASSADSQVLNGSDTLGLLDGKIAYHYTSYFII